MRTNTLSIPEVSFPASALAEEALTTSQWALILVRAEISKTESSARRLVQMQRLPGEMSVIRGGMTRVTKFSDLPQRWQESIDAKRQELWCKSCADLLAVGDQISWEPPTGKHIEETTAYNKEKAQKVRLVMDVYFGALDNGAKQVQANLKAQAKWLELFGKAISERQIRNRADRVAEAGGHGVAPLEAYGDFKCVAHKRARLEHRVPEELQAEFAFRTTKMEHMRQAYESLVIDWKMGREVRGLGAQVNGEPFPFKFEQLRRFAASTAARRMGSHGKARAVRECLPFLHTSTATLRRCELLLLDDTRIDIIACRDRDGFPVALKSYILMDVASRQILGYVVKEEENLKAEDVWALLAHVLSAAGLPVGYQMHIKFERGAVACSAAAETLLRSLWPGRINVHRTSMDGGRSNGSEWLQKGSGHWMGKSHIESFMRTLAFRLEHIPGQRGGTHERQPAQLGYQTKGDFGMIEYSRGSQIHESVRGEVADRVLRYIETGDVNSPRQLRLEARAGGRLMPVRWVRDAIREAVAHYNDCQHHRMQGFSLIEYQDERGALRTRVQSPNERAAALETRCELQRISGADAAGLLKWRGRAVTVTRQGVTFSCAPWRNLRFWKSDSRVIHEVSQLATMQRKYVALVDEEQLRAWAPGADWVPQIHLIGDITYPDAWKPGDEGRYLESLPLADVPELLDPEAMAAGIAETRQVAARAERELIYAARGVLPEVLAEEKERASKLEGAVTMLRQSRQQAEESQMLSAMDSEQTAPSRAEQRAENETNFATSLPFHEANEREF